MKVQVLRVLGSLFTVAVLVTPAAAQDDADRVHSIDELTVLPALESPERAARVIQDSYPTRLQRRGIGGSVRLQFVIEVDGSVDESSIIIVAATIRRLGEAAKEAVLRVKFTPGMVDGRPVRTEILFPITYRT